MSTSFAQVQPETHCHQTIEELFRVGMRRGEENSPLQFLQSILVRYEMEVVKEQDRQREASRTSYREKLRWRVPKVRRSREEGGEIEDR